MYLPSSSHETGADRAHTAQPSRSRCVHRSGGRPGPLQRGSCPGRQRRVRREEKGAGGEHRLRRRGGVRRGRAGELLAHVPPGPGLLLLHGLRRNRRRSPHGQAGRWRRFDDIRADPHRHRGALARGPGATGRYERQDRHSRPRRRPAPEHGGLARRGRLPVLRRPRRADRGLRGGRFPHPGRPLPGPAQAGPSLAGDPFARQHRAPPAGAEEPSRDRAAAQGGGDQRPRPRRGDEGHGTRLRRVRDPGAAGGNLPAVRRRPAGVRQHRGLGPQRDHPPLHGGQPGDARRRAAPHRRGHVVRPLLRRRDAHPSRERPLHARAARHLPDRPRGAGRLRAADQAGCERRDRQ